MSMKIQLLNVFLIGFLFSACDFDLNRSSYEYKTEDFPGVIFKTLRTETSTSVAVLTDRQLVFLGATNFGQFIKKVTSDGDTVWTKLLLDTVSLNLGSIASAVDGGFIVSASTYSYSTSSSAQIVIRFDNDGVELWRLRLPQDDGIGRIYSLDDGGFVVMAFQFRYPNSRYGIVKVNSSGILEYEKYYENDLINSLYNNMQSILCGTN